MTEQIEMLTAFNIENSVNVVTEGWYSILKISIYLLPIGLFSLIITLVRKIKKKSCRIIADIAFYSLSFGLVLFLMSAPVVLIDKYDRDALIEAYKSENYQIAEGIVEVLHEQPSGGHDKGDIIVVNDVRFEIDYFTSTRAYNKTIAYEGVLKDGVYAKIYYNGNKILRVDIQQNTKIGE